MNSLRTVQKITLALVCLQILLITSATAWAAKRDWQQHPASIEIPRAERVAVIGDIHGAFAEMAATLASLGVTEPVATNTFDLKWIGGDMVLISMGDLADRGMYSKEVYDAIMSLEEQAKKVGGRVITILGNHEIMQINRVNETRARARDYEWNHGAQFTIDSFERGGVNYYDAMSPNGKYGSWIRQRPLFAIVNGYMFIHAGPPFPLRSREELTEEYRYAIDNNVVLYKRGLLLDEYGPLYTRGWWSPNIRNIAKDRDFAKKALDKFQIRGLLFGHTTGAMGPPGFVNHVGTQFFSMDVGMTFLYSHSNGGGMLMAIEDNGIMVFRARYPDRPEMILGQIDFKTGENVPPYPGIFRSSRVPPQTKGCGQNLGIRKTANLTIFAEPTSSDADGSMSGE